MSCGRSIRMLDPDTVIYCGYGGELCEECTEQSLREVSPPQLEIRIGQGETPGYYLVEGWRNGQPKYIRTGNVTSHEAWSYGDAWMRDEITKNAKETK